MNVTRIPTRPTLARAAAGLGVALAATVLVGGAAFAGSQEPGPPPIELDDLVLDDDPVIPDVPQLEGPQLEGPQLEGPVLQIPDDTGPPVVEIPDIPIDIPIDISELPECTPWEPGLTGAVHADPVAGTVTATIQYTGDAAATCDTLFVVHSIQLDATMVPVGLLAEEHVTMGDIAAAGGSVSVTVPIDPCFARVFTDGPEAYVLADTYHADGCPPETTETTEPEPTDTTEPPTVTDPGPTTTTPGVPSGELPATGASSTTIALLGGLLIAVGLGMACAVRGAQHSHRADPNG